MVKILRTAWAKQNTCVGQPFLSGRFSSRSATRAEKRPPKRQPCLARFWGREVSESGKPLCKETLEGRFLATAPPGESVPVRVDPGLIEGRVACGCPQLAECV